MREVTRFRRRVLIERLFRNYGILIALITFLASLVYLCLIPIAFGPLVTPADNVDENSLLVNQAASLYGAFESKAVTDFVTEYREHAFSTSRSRAIWLRDKFRDAGLISHIHYSRCGGAAAAGDPAGSPRNSACGTTVYAVLRAPRAEGNEALALTTVWDNELLGKQNIYGVAQSYAMSLMWRNAHYWAKDILFAVGDSVSSLKHFVHDYHSPPKSPPVAPFMFRAGEIHIAVHCEVHSKSPNVAVLELYGHYGQMSNLDMVLVLVKALESRHLRVENRFDEQYPERGVNHTMPTVAAMRQLPRLLLDQALERQHGPHAAFKYHGIDAVSLFATESAAVSLHRGGKLDSLAQALESAFVSFNNLRERLHHASWVYLMVSSRAVIYFATFVYLVVVMLGALHIAGYCIWLNSGLSPVELGPSEHDVAKELVERSDFTPKTRDVYGALRVTTAVVLFGCCTFLVNNNSVQAALSVAGTAAVYFYGDSLRQHMLPTEEATDMLVVSGLCITAASGISISIVNFGLGLAFALLTAPVWVVSGIACYRRAAPRVSQRAGVFVLRAATYALHPAFILGAILRAQGERNQDQAGLAQMLLWCVYLPIHLIWATLLAAAAAAA